jgi:hypothetical protein
LRDVGLKRRVRAPVGSRVAIWEAVMVATGSGQCLRVDWTWGATGILRMPVSKPGMDVRSGLLENEIG